MNLSPATTTRNWIALFAVFALVSTGTALWIAEGQLNTRLQEIGLRHQRADTVSALFVANELSQGLTQLTQLRSDPRVRSLDSSQSSSLAQLESLFVTLMNLDPRVAQARWIDWNGRERVRVDRRAGELIAVPQAQLQDKSDRDYFAQVMALAPDTLWVSTIDLNEENGEIEKPLRPTVRMATAVPSPRAEGFLILNLDARRLLSQVIESADDPATVGFLDHRGQWIIGPNGAEEWALQLGISEPQTGPVMSQLEQLDAERDGVSRQPFGLVSWARVLPPQTVLPLVAPKLSVLTHWPEEKVQAVVWQFRWVALAVVGLLLFPIALLLRRLFIAELRSRRATQRQLEQEIQARAELEEQADQLLRSNRDLDAFAYAAAHDLRTPLRAITQYSGILREDLTELSPEYQGYLKRITDLSEALDRMLRGLLSYSRLGAVGDETERLDLKQVIPAMAQLYSHDQFSIHVETEHPVRVPKVLIEMIVRNIVMNAVKHHHKAQGRLIFTTQREGDWVTLYCTDDGPGIDAANWDEVFLVFRRLNPQKNSEHEGLGLAMVRRAAESVGGSAWIESSSDAGTCFAVRMPAA